jgi:ABC-type hemin transport system ATPase subunit
MIVVSHDLGLLHRYATKVLILSRGQMNYCGDPYAILEREEILRRAGLRLPLPLRLKKILGTKHS